MEPSSNGIPPHETEPVKAYLAYCDAVRQGDLGQMHAAVIPEQAAQMEDPGFKQKLPILQFMLPGEIEVADIQQEGDEAKLTLRGKGDDEGQKGSATLIRQQGKWLVAGETWYAGS